MLKIWIKKLLAPPRLKALRRQFGLNQKIRILDVGCGNDSCALTRYWLNVQEYHGVDREHWQGRELDYKRMDQLFFLDLEKSDLREIPDLFYDALIMSHVIEHLKCGEEVLFKLLPKLKTRGVIYIETPSELTLRYPSAEGFLNFYDDPTHQRLYPIDNLNRLLSERNFTVLRSGYRRDWARILLLSPLALFLNLFWFLPVRRKILASGLWDLLGVAKFSLAQKNETPTPKSTLETDTKRTNTEENSAVDLPLF
ncbi:MAG: class I SAM-dependent methyltransferase [Bdellovibrio sp.]